MARAISSFRTFPPSNEKKIFTQTFKSKSICSNDGFSGIYLDLSVRQMQMVHQVQRSDVQTFWYIHSVYSFKTSKFPMSWPKGNLDGINNWRRQHIVCKRYIKKTRCEVGLFCYRRKIIWKVFRSLLWISDGISLNLHKRSSCLMKYQEINS